jgi:DNA-binding transcriptional LysR family regulator
VLDVRKLAMLREVAFRGSIAAAARAMNYTRSAVSQQISALETAVGVPLLQRHGNTMELTAAGADLVERTDRVLDELRAAEVSLAERRGQLQGVLRIGLPVRDTQATVGDALAAIHQRYPLLTIDLRALPPADAVRDLRRGLLDMALSASYEPGTPLAAGLQAFDLDQDEVRLVVRADHPLSSETSCELSVLADEPWVLGTRTSLGELVLARCRNAGFEPRVVATVDDLNTALRMVSSGWGVTLAPERTPQPPDNDLVRIPVPELSIFRTSQLLVRSEDRFIPRIAVVVSAIQRANSARLAGQAGVDVEQSVHR